MIITKDNKDVLETSGPALDISNYRIDDEALPHVMEMLRNMYADPPLAVIREYISNAIDAHVHAKQTKPIQVHVPNFVEPWFGVRDYGHGLSKEETKRLLFGYGASGDHKRESNDQIGGFGIGCKSGFSVTRSFSYTIWHEGVKRIWDCALNEDDLGTVRLVYEAPSDEPSGIGVNIPAGDGLSEYKIAQALRKFLPYVDLKTTPVELTNTELVLPSIDIMHQQTIEAKIDGKPFKLTCKVLASDQPIYRYGTPAIQVGVSLFEVDPITWRDIDSDTSSKHSQVLGTTIIELPIGLIALAPTRESLQMTPRSTSILTQILTPLKQDKFWKQFAREAMADKELNIRQKTQTLYRFSHEGYSNKKEMVHEGHAQLPPGSAVWVKALRTVYSWGVDWNTRRGCAPDLHIYTSPDKHQPTAIPFYNPGDVTIAYVMKGDEDPTETLIAMTHTAFTRGLMTYEHNNRVLLIKLPENSPEIPWLKDCSVIVLNDLLEEDGSVISFAAEPAPRAPRTYTASRLKGTKLLALRSEAAKNTEAASRWWDSVYASAVPTDETKVYIPIDSMYPIFPSVEGRYIDSESTRLYSDNVKLLRNGDLAHHFPEIRTLYGVRRNSLESLDETFISFWDYLGQKFLQQQEEDLLCGETLLQLLAASRVGFSRCVNPPAKIPRTMQAFQNLRDLKEALEWDKIDADLTTLWAHFLLRLDSSYNLNTYCWNPKTKVAVDNALGALNLDIDGKFIFQFLSRGPWTRWIRNTKVRTWVDISDLTKSPLGKILKGVCDHHPILSLLLGADAYLGKCKVDGYDSFTSSYDLETKIRKLSKTNPTFCRDLWKRVNPNQE